MERYENDPFHQRFAKVENVWKAVRAAGMVRPADDDLACGSVIVARYGAIVLNGRRVFAEFVFEEPFDIIDGWRFAHWKILEMIPAAPVKDENNS